MKSNFFSSLKTFPFQVIKHPELLDGSEIFRPEGKEIQEFRVYDVNSTNYIQDRVKRTYYAMHTNQTVAFGQEKVQYQNTSF